MDVAASQCVLIIGVNLIRPKVFPDMSHIPPLRAAVELQTMHSRFAKGPHCAANRSAIFALQIFLHEITDTAGLFLFPATLMFISNIYESCPQLTHLSSRRRTNRPAPASRLFRDKFRDAVAALLNTTFLHSGHTDSCARNAAFEKWMRDEKWECEDEVKVEPAAAGTLQAAAKCLFDTRLNYVN